jgi:hypothetical protein
VVLVDSYPVDHPWKSVDHQSLADPDFTFFGQSQYNVVAKKCQTFQLIPIPHLITGVCWNLFKLPTIDINHAFPDFEGFSKFAIIISFVEGFCDCSTR